MKRSALFFSFLIVLSSSFLSCATGFADYDRNDDSLWELDEFGAAYNEDWTTWDSDADGYLDDNEFYDTSYGWVDEDDDGLIDEKEWNNGYNNLYGDYGTVGDFGEYDLNDDDYLDENEWSAGWGDSDWFNDYDANDDELVDNNEWDEGIFDTWDDNDDGFWNDDEFDTFSTYYDTW